MRDLLFESYPLLSPAIGAAIAWIACRGYYQRRLEELEARRRQERKLPAAAVTHGIEQFRLGFSAGARTAAILGRTSRN